MDDGRTPELRRMMVEYGEQFWGSGWGPLYGFLGGNPLAAMPSLHFATSVMAAHLLAETGPVAGALGWAYAGTLGLALVYLGEHYVVDLAAGLALAEGIRRATPAATPLLARVSAAVQALEARARGMTEPAALGPAGQPGAAGGRRRPRGAPGAPAHARATLVALAGFLLPSLAALYFLLPQLAGLDDTWNRIEDGRPAWIDRRAAAAPAACSRGYVAMFRGVFVRARPTRIGWARELPDHDGGAGGLAPVRGRRRRRPGAHRVGAAARRDAQARRSPTRRSPSSS